MQGKQRLLKMLDGGVGAAACRLISALGLFGIRRMPPPPLSFGREDRIRILVIRPGGIGDMILLLPALKALQAHYPNAAVSVFCEHRNAAVLQLLPMTAIPLIADRQPLRSLVALRRTAFDAVIDSEQFHHLSAVIALWTGAPVRIGFSITPRRNTLYTHLVRYATDGPEGHQFLNLLVPLGVEPPAFSLDGVLAPPQAVAPTHKTAPCIAIQIATGSRYKDWPEGRFAEVMTGLYTSHRASFILLGSRSQRRCCATAHALLPAEVRARTTLTAGTLELPQTAAVLAQADLFIGPDSGLGHMAQAYHTASVVLFGATDPAKWGHRTPIYRAISDPPPCAPCALFGYHKPCNTQACIRALGTDAVLREARALLDRR